MVQQVRAADFAALQPGITVTGEATIARVHYSSDGSSTRMQLDLTNSSGDIRVILDPRPVRMFFDSDLGRLVRSVVRSQDLYPLHAAHRAHHRHNVRHVDGHPDGGIRTRKQERPRDCDAKVPLRSLQHFEFADAQPPPLPRLTHFASGQWGNDAGLQCDRHSGRARRHSERSDSTPASRPGAPDARVTRTGLGRFELTSGRARDRAGPLLAHSRSVTEPASRAGDASRAHERSVGGPLGHWRSLAPRERHDSGTHRSGL